MYTDFLPFFRSPVAAAFLLLYLLLPATAPAQDVKFRHFTADDGLSQNSVTCILQAYPGFIWFGSNAGLNCYDGYTFTVYRHDAADPRSLPADRITALCQDTSGTLWVGTAGGGLAQFDAATERFVRFRHHEADPLSLSDDRISAIYEDGSGTLWIGTGNGLNRLDRPAGTFRHFFPGAGDGRRSGMETISAVCEDGSGELWVGTEAGGLNRFDRNSGYFNRLALDGENPSPRKGAAIRALYPDRSGHLWIGTAGIGLFCFDSSTNRLTRFVHDPENANSLSYDHVMSIGGDLSGRLWIATGGGGLNMYDPASGRFTRYTRDPGNPNSLGSDTLRAVYADRANNIWIGLHSTGISKLDQAHDASPPVLSDNPPLVFTTVKRFSTRNIIGNAISEKGISTRRELVLSHDENMISVEFATLNFRHPEKNRYAYQLEGIMEQWIQLGTKREITLTNLDPGRYTLRVKGTNNDGLWNEAGASLNIIVLPPWWRTWWAYTLFYLAFLGMLYVVRRYELNRVRLRNRLKVKQNESDSLKQLDQLKSRFFTNISHEFRTPLTLILGEIDSVLASTGETENRTRLEVAHRNARRMQLLINQLLDLARLEAGSMALKAVHDNLVSFLKNLLASFEHLAERQGITLQFCSSHSEIRFYYDPEKLEKVFYNLLSNAFKFTPQGGRIAVELGVEMGSGETGIVLETGTRGNGEAGELREAGKRGSGETGNLQRRFFSRFADSLIRRFPGSPIPRFPDSRQAQHVRITVRDNGSGIAAAHLPHIFDRFYQADRTGLAGGSGIGLSLVRELVELHGGDISVGSKVGKGTEFTVRLPLGEAVISDRLSVVGDAPLNDPDTEIQHPASSIQHPASSIQHPTSGHPEILLLVDDNPDIRAYAGEQLEGSGYRVICATDGEAGLASAREIIPDLIICDIMMPKLDGYQLCRYLKADERTSHIPLIMLTARASLDDKIAGLETGADDYLLKPFSARELLARVHNLISLRRQLRRRFSTATVIKPSEVAATPVDQVFLARVIAAVEAHLGDEHFGVEELAAAVNMSSSQINRKLRGLIDQPASQLVRSLRLQRAADLLRQNAGSVAEIAYQVGFSDQAHFTRSFKKQFGCAPSAYRDVAGLARK